MRIGVVHPFWSFWAEAGGPGLEQAQAEVAGRADRALGRLGQVIWSIRVEPGEPSRPTPPVDIVVVAVAMAAPPDPTLGVLDRFPGVPVLLWAVLPAAAVPAGFDHAGIVGNGGTVGLPMISAQLTQQGRAFDVVVGPVEASASSTGSVAVGPEDLATAVRAAGAAARIRGARIARVGDALPGYEFTGVSPTALARLGIEVVDLPAAELGERTRRALAEGPASVGTASRAERAAVAYEAALTGLVTEHDLAAGTLNCHVAELRFHPGLRSAPCRALGTATTSGKPWTCTGDLSTALAMLVVASLDAPTLYHEIETLDLAADVAVLANSGEHDNRFDLAESAAADNPWYPDHPTAIRRGTITAGPAALVACRSVGEALDLVVADGDFTGQGWPATGTVNAAFRFSSGPVDQAWRRWCLAGVSHHACATDHRLAADLERVVRYLGLGLVSV